MQEICDQMFLSLLILYPNPMKYTFFICSLLFATGTFAQWNNISTSKFHELKISEANKKTAFYMGIPCEVKLSSFKNKKLWLTSPNAARRQTKVNFSLVGVSCCFKTIYFYLIFKTLA